MKRISVLPEGRDRYRINIRGHELVVDQPTHAGGEDAGPTPVELYVGALASCVAHYAGRFCDRHDVERSDLAVHVDWEMASDRPARVASIEVVIDVPAAMPEDRRAAFLAVASHCTVHNTIERPPLITIGPRGGDAADARASA